MKAFNLAHWNLSEANRELLFFAQSLEEMLFHYGHDSLNVPALNFCSLCIEIHNTIKKIDAEIMRPLFEELKTSYDHDPIVKRLFRDNFSSLFYPKCFR